MSDIVPILESQYGAALRMLRSAIEKCPDDLWSAPGLAAPYWSIAYHTLFYTDLYLCRSEREHTPWPHALYNEAEYSDVPPADRHNTKEQLLEFCDSIIAGLGDRLRDDDVAGESGFSWLPFSRMEHHLYNLRHLQHHIGQLAVRMRQAGAGSIDWVGRVKSP